MSTVTCPVVFPTEVSLNEARRQRSARPVQVTDSCLPMRTFLLVRCTSTNTPRKLWMEDISLGASISDATYALAARTGFLIGAWNESEYVVCEEVQAACFEDLDWSRTTVWVEGSASGWLSPKAAFWPCRWGHHGDMAHNVIGISYTELEENGWIHVNCHGAVEAKTYRMRDAKMVPTEAQLKWLTEHGHDIAYHGHGLEAQPVETINVNGYFLDAEADRAAFEKLMAAAPKR